MRQLAAGLILLAALPGPSALAAQAPASPFGRSWLRITAGADRVSDGFGDWSSLEARTAVVAGRRDLLLGEVRWQRAFGDRGVYGGLGLRHAFGSKWLTTVSLGGGTGEFFLPELRFDASLHRKLLAGDRLIATAGFTAVRSKDVYRDRAVFGSLTHYWSGAVLEAGGRINWSNPGSESSARGFGALTLGRDGVRRVAIRASAGREAYQLVGIQPALRAFSSSEVGIEWEEWLGIGWSIVVGGERYHNPFYDRTGGRLGVARHW